MSKQTINIGASPNDGTGTPLRTSFDYCNQNFTEIYTALGGGVALPGATTQVIFNDGGTNLAGDAGLVYNKTTDALTVAGLVTAGSATITGDLTVDTSTLKVDSTNNRVGIGTASPNNTLTVRGTQDAGIEVNSADSNSSRIITAYDPANTRFYINSTNSGSGTVLPLDFLIGNAAQYRIAASGVFSWFDGAGGTRMTLNSTGLGIGTASATTKLDVLGSGDGELRLRAGSDAALIFSETTGNKNWKIKPSSGTLCFQYSATAFNSGYANLMVVTETGNVGVSVTPSAWNSSYRVLEIGRSGNAFWGQVGTSGVFMSSNALLNGAGSFVYSNTAASTYYTQNTGRHEWYNAASGTAGNAITFTQAMTLDSTGLGVTGQLSTANVLKATGNPGLSAAGATEAFVAHNTTYGAILYGSGTTCDAALLDRGTNPRLTVTTTGAQVIGDLSVTSGNVVMATSGKGIDFSATANSSGTMTSELLADYEEGTFTPTIIGTSTAGVGVYTVQDAKYTKVGRLVTVEVDLGWSAHTGTGNMQITGLPFTTNATVFTSVTLGYVDNIALTAGNFTTAYTSKSSTLINLNQTPTGGGATTGVPIDVAGRIMVSVTYSV